LQARPSHHLRKARRIHPPAATRPSPQTREAVVAHGNEQSRSSALAKGLLRGSRAVRSTHGLAVGETVSMKETPDWRAVCGKTARTVRREGRRKPSLPLSPPVVTMCRLECERAGVSVRPLSPSVAHAP